LLIRERERMGMRRGRKGRGGDMVPWRRYGGDKWVTFKASVLAREGRGGGRGGGGATVLGEKRNRWGGSMHGAGGTVDDSGGF
jgi:hypothetical protein